MFAVTGPNTVGFALIESNGRCICTHEPSVTCEKDAASGYKSYEYDGATVLLPTYLTDLTALCQPLTDIDLPTH